MCQFRFVKTRVQTVQISKNDNFSLEGKTNRKRKRSQVGRALRYEPF